MSIHPEDAACNLDNVEKLSQLPDDSRRGNMLHTELSTASVD